MGKQIRTRLTAVLLLSAALLGTAARPQKDGGKDNLVRLMKADYIEQLEIGGQQCRKALKSTFLHNGTYLISDSAMWNVDTKVINCVGHVKVIQDETILTSDKLDYFIDDDLAQFRGTLVQLQNKKKNILRTRNLDYNTRDSVAFFRGGASMRDQDGQLIESASGTYNSSKKFFTFQDDVNMFTDSVFVRTSTLHYYSNEERADFPVSIDFWRDGYMLSASRGWYNRGHEVFFFTNRVHGLSDEQEFWADTLYYYRNPGDMLLLGKAQVQDTSRNVTAMANRIHYQDTLRQVTLRRDAAVALFTENEEKRDTIYIGADTLVYRQIRYCDIPEGTVKASSSRLSDVLTDAVTEFRRKAAEAAAAARAEEEKKMKEGLAKPAAAPKVDKGTTEGKPGEAPLEAVKPKGPTKGGTLQLPADSLKAPMDSLAVSQDSLATSPDSLGVQTDSLALQADTLAGRIPSPEGTIPPQPADSSAAAFTDSSFTAQGDSTALGAPADSSALMTPPDTSRYGFAKAIRNVKIFRRDLQVRCDSMVYNDLDSIARFYTDPVVWNDGNRQYTADSIFVLVGGGGARKASLQSNAFVITQDAPDIYDQIKGAEIMAYFDSTTNTLKRFDALGGSSALFFLEENDVIATVNKVECKMLSANLKDGTLDQVFYFDQPVNNAYPIVQLPEAEKRMKGFSWRDEERPAGPEDITPIKLRISEREYFRRRPQPQFKFSETYFPGYIPGIRREIAVRDSLARLPKPKVPELPPADTLFQAADSLAAQADSLLRETALPDSTLAAGMDSLAVQAVTAGADSLAVRDTSSTAAVIQHQTDPLSVPTVDPKQKKKEERELRRKLRIAARDARNAAREKRWAELDSLDAAKAAAKELKKLEKERARKVRQLKALQRQKEKEDAKLQKYIEKYRKEYERQQQKSKSSPERAPSAEGGGEVPATPEPGQQAAGSDPVLRDDGPADDGTVLGGSGVPGT